MAGSAVLAFTLGAAGVAGAFWRPLAPPPLGVRNDLDQFAPAVLDTIQAYRQYRVYGAVAALALSTAVPVAFVATRRGRRLLQRVGGPRPHSVLRGGLVAAAVAFGANLASLPVEFAMGFVQDGRWGFRTSSLAAWVRDWLVAAGLTWLVAGLAGAGFVFAVGRWPRSWHWRIVVLGTVGTAVLVLAGPLVYEPLWLRTRPLEPGPTRTAVEQVLTRAGRAGAPILVGDASRRTTKVNAYASGLGPSRRFVLFDTLLDLPPDRVAAVVAHELAHDEHHDLPRMVLLTATGLLPGAWLARRAMESGWTRRVLTPRGPSDPRLVAVAAAVAALASAATLPISMAISRRAEAAADHTALVLTRDPGTQVRIQRVFVVRDLADPRPPGWQQQLFGSHPSPSARIQAAVDYAAREGLPLPGQAELVDAERAIRNVHIQDSGPVRRASG